MLCANKSAKVVGKEVVDTAQSLENLNRGESVTLPFGQGQSEFLRYATAEDEFVPGVPKGSGVVDDQGRALFGGKPVLVVRIPIGRRFVSASHL